MKILIFGGTGAMGTHLVDLLRDTDNEVVITTRAKRESSQNINYIVGDAKNNEFLTKLLQEKWDVIIDFMMYSSKDFKYRVNQLLDSTLQYVFLSSARVYADSNEPIKETYSRLLNNSTDKEFLSSDEYALAKARQEDILKNSGKSNWTIIRPYITYSSHRLQLGILEKEDWLYRALKGRTIVFSEEINSKITTMTFGLDVARGIKAILGNPNTLSETFHLTSNQSLHWREILKIYLDVLEKHLGYRPKVVLENLDNFLSYHPATYQIKYDRLFNRKFDNEKIGNYIDVFDFTSTEEGLKVCLEDFLKNPSFNLINWNVEALKDRKTNEFAKLSEIQGVKQKVKYILYRLFVK
jgi:nucleoside-diphosphate-sugar epimerase